MKRYMLVVVAMVACTRAVEVGNEREQIMAATVSPSIGIGAAPAGTLERRVLDLASCSLEGYQIDASCPAMEALAKELAAPGGSKTLSVALGARLLASESAAVRLETAKLMGTDTASRNAIVETARRESNVHVRQAFVRMLANDGAKHAAVGALLLESTSHADRDVRLQAVYALTSPANRALPGGAAKLAHVIEHDPNERVRQAACLAAGRLGDDALVATYDRMTASTADPAMYATCMEGLVAMFHNHPSFDTASEAAYRLFVRRLAAEPRTEVSPPWGVMSSFCYYSHEADLDKLAAWKQRAPWFDAVELKRLITSIVVDKNASWMARAAGVESLIGLGASKAELQALKPAYTTKVEADRMVLAKIDSALAE